MTGASMPAPGEAPEGSHVPGIATTYSSGQGAADAVGAPTACTTPAAATTDNIATKRFAPIKHPTSDQADPCSHHRYLSSILVQRRAMHCYEKQILGGQ